MSILRSILCLLGRHQPERRLVQWDGHGYVGECRCCGREIRHVRHGKWHRAKA